MPSTGVKATTRSTAARGADFLDGGTGYNTVNYLSIDEGVQISVDGTQPQTQYDTLLHFSVVQRLAWQRRDLRHRR